VPEPHLGLKNMKRKKVEFTWEDEESQKVFAEWMPFPDSNISAEDVDTIEKFVRIKPPMKILDVGCGNARHAIEFARRGYHVVGIDVAKIFLDKAKTAASKADVSVELRYQRASELNENESFDFALAFWHTIGFMSHNEIHQHFKAIYKALKPNCRFLYVFRGPKLIPGKELEQSQSIKTWGEKNGKFILSEKSIQDGYRNEYCVVIDTNKTEIIEYNEHQKAMSLDNVVSYLRNSGFASVKPYNDFDKNPATPEDFSVFLCHKA
jgi:SAM-dependent methyltransferase